MPHRSKKQRNGGGGKVITTSPEAEAKAKAEAEAQAQAEAEEAQAGEAEAKATEAEATAEEASGSVETPSEQPQPPAKVPSVTDGLNEVLSGLDPNSPTYAVVKEQLDKLLSEENKSANEKARVAFDTELKAELIKLLDGDKGLVAKHGVDLSSRQVVIKFPKGKPVEVMDLSLSATTTSKSKRSGNGGGSFPTSWGKATYIENGKEEVFDSPSALLKHLGLRTDGVGGHKTTIDNFLKPVTEDKVLHFTVADDGIVTPEAGYAYSVDAEKGVRFIVKKL